jgi:hypothetical protein
VRKWNSVADIGSASGKGASIDRPVRARSGSHIPESSWTLMELDHGVARPSVS